MPLFERKGLVTVAWFCKKDNQRYESDGSRPRCRICGKKMRKIGVVGRTEKPRWMK